METGSFDRVDTTGFQLLSGEFWRENELGGPDCQPVGTR
jgi:hypothetical protein